ncbi:hypothetical protein ACVNNN_15430 [Lysinibacillus fusiformis]|uniref:hypothetical protein n=1 Tax=Lysinibacillus sp. PWR01 TaxID=3342384 RepID=UPI00372D0289
MNRPRSTKIIFNDPKEKEEFFKWLEEDDSDDEGIKRARALLQEDDNEESTSTITIIPISTRRGTSKIYEPRVGRANRETRVPDKFKEIARIVAKHNNVAGQKIALKNGDHVVVNVGVKAKSTIIGNKGKTRGLRTDR